MNPPEPEWVDDENFSHVADILPEGCMATSSFRLVEFIKPDGEPGLYFKVDGDIRISTTIGLLELAKASYVRDAYEEDSE